MYIYISFHTYMCIQREGGAETAREGLRPGSQVNRDVTGGTVTCPTAACAGHAEGVRMLLDAGVPRS